MTPTDRAPVREHRVRTADGVRLRLVELPRETDLGVVLVPGFSCSWDKPFVRRVAHWLADHAGVVCVDLRGHGGSAGRSTLGDAEVLDVDAAVASARRRYRRVVTVGFSMGGGAALRHAALLGARTCHGVDAVVSVSAASRWWRTETRPMRRLHVLAGTAAGRLATRAVWRTRVDPAAAVDPPTDPVRLVGRIAPTPVLLVHGGRDPYLTTDNAQALYDAAGEPRELWILPAYGHAELAVDEALAARIGRHVAALAGGGDAGPGATITAP